MERWLYLIIDLLSLAGPLSFSFHPRANFSKKWKYVFPALLAAAIPFLIWDELFTQHGIWGFNPKYTLGIYVFHLPIEEVLFFFCIPYACIFTYEAVNYFSKRERISQHLSNFISDGLIFGLLLLGTFHSHQWYTSVTSFATAAFLILLRRLWEVDFLGRFYFAFLFILIPFFIVNGILTGTGLPEPIVWYNNQENLGIRMLTIPVEDTFYGMLMLLLSISVYHFLQRKKPEPTAQA